MSWTYQASPPFDDQECRRWEGMLEERTGIHFATHRGILRAALWQRMCVIGCTSFDEYYRQVCGTGPAATAEWTALVNGLTVRETRFFRHPASFDRARQFLLANWSRPLRLWSAGCASGEEAWSLAMLAAECAAHTGQSQAIEVIGTDISATALTAAKAGVYPASRLAGLADVQRQRFFEALPDGHCRVRIEDLPPVRFCQGNLLHAEATGFDLVFCQNVLIYFRAPRREAVLDALVRALRPGGLLVTGPGETGRWQDARLARVPDAAAQAWLRRADNNN